MSTVDMARAVSGSPSNGNRARLDGNVLGTGDRMGRIAGSGAGLPGGASPTCLWCERVIDSVCVSSRNESKTSSWNCWQDSWEDRCNQLRMF